MGVGEVQGGVIDGSNLRPKLVSGNWGVVGSRWWVVQGGIPIAIERRWEAGGGLLTEQLLSDKYKPIY